MSEHIEVRIDVWPPGNQTAVPCNLQMRHENSWVSLGTLGTTQYGGPNAEEKTVAYREAVWQVTQLFLAAPALLTALKESTVYLDRLVHSHIEQWPHQLRAALEHGQQAIKEAKGE